MASGREDAPLAPLQAGQAVWTPKQLKKGIKKHHVVILGLSGASCGDYCTQFENEYAQLDRNITNATDARSAELRKRVFFARLDADRYKSTAAKYGVDVLPAILVFRGKRMTPIKYTGVHHASALLPLAHKLGACKKTPPRLATQEAALAFAAEHAQSTVVIGMFGTTRDDDYADWLEASARLCLRHDVWLAEVVSEEARAALRRKPWRWYKHLPSLVLLRKPDTAAATERTLEPTERAAVQLSTLTEGSIELWVDSNAIPHVGRLEPKTWHQYEALRLPMAMLFLSTDVRASMNAADRTALAALRGVAPRYRARITSLFGDGKRYKEKMKLLGLLSGATPSMAINTGDGRILTFDGEYTELGVESWLRAFLGLSVKARTQGLERGRDSPKPPKASHGVVGDAHADAFVEGQDNVTALTRDTLRSFVMDPYKDVMLVMIAHDSADSQAFYKYVKRSTDRFIELGIRSVAVAKFDVQRHLMPADMGLQYSKLPAVVMLPAKDKEPPFRYLTGKAKAQHIMWFVQKHASYKFDLPEDPHLSREMHLLKLKQIKENQEYKKKEEQEQAAAKAPKEL